MNGFNPDRIIGYYERPNIIKPIFDEMGMDEFKERFPGKSPVLMSDLADDDDYTPDPEEEQEVIEPLTFANSKA